MPSPSGIAEHGRGGPREDGGLQDGGPAVRLAQEGLLEGRNPERRMVQLPLCGSVEGCYLEKGFLQT